MSKRKRTSSSNSNSNLQPPPIATPTTTTMPELSPPPRVSPPARLHTITSSASPALFPSSPATTTTTNGPRSPSNQVNNNGDNAATSPPASAAPQTPPPPPVKKHTQDLNYMHRPPRIVPNYGKRKQVRALPKTCVSRVLLYDNMTQQQMLDVKVSGILSERRKTCRLLDMHRNSFVVRKFKKHIRENVLDVDQAMPVHVTPAKVSLPPTTTRRHVRSIPTQPPPQSPSPPSSSPPPPQTAEAAPHESRAALWRQDVILEEEEPLDEATATASTTDKTARPSNPGENSATKAGAKIGAHDSGHAEDQGDLETLVLPPPTQPHQERYGATTSFGFSHQEPSLMASVNKRASHTAAANVYRSEPRRGKGDGGGGDAHSHNNGLPDIHTSPGQHPASRMVVHVDSGKNGLTRLFHAFQQHLPPELGGRSGTGAGAAAEVALAKDRLLKHAFEERTTEDDRYLSLERLLVPNDPPTDGYLELSPSFHTPRQAMTLSRPSSLQSPSNFRRHRRSSVSNPGAIAMSSATATSNSPANGFVVGSM